MVGLSIRAVIAVALAALGSGCATGKTGSPSAPLRLNDLQLIGTHNSYHIAPDRAVFEVMQQTGYKESDQWTADALAQALDFTHLPIREQLDLGLRVFEFDMHDDPVGGRYADPGVFKALSPDARAALPSVDPAGELEEPGIKIFHTVNTDVRSHCLRLVTCLGIIRDWSAANSGHLPIFVQLETKEGRKPIVANAYPQTEPAPFDDAAWARLHREIEAVFDGEAILSPDEVRGDYATVREAIRAAGWPSVVDARGKIIFLLIDDRAKSESYRDFVRSTGRSPILFVSIDEDDPDTAWLIRPTPKLGPIRALVKQGYLVYTRADAHGDEARRNDLSRAGLAVETGAQLISTDYPVPDERLSDYRVVFQGGQYVRCNPVRRPEGCAD